MRKVTQKLMTELGLVPVVKVSKEEYDALPPVEKYPLNNSEPENPSTVAGQTTKEKEYYRYDFEHVDYDEVNLLMQAKTLKATNTIKSCVVFFTVLTALNIIASIIIYIKLF